MNKSFLNFLFFFCILLSNVCSPLFAHVNLGESSLHHSVQSYSVTQKNHQNPIISGKLVHTNKVFEVDPAEIEEEEENTLYKIGAETTYASASLYLLSILFLFTTLKNSNNFLKLFTFSPAENRRYVLFQVFRL